MTYEKLKEEIYLQINQELFKSGVISQEIYELAKTKIVARKNPIKV